MKTYFIAFLSLLVLFANVQLFSCTIFYVSLDNKTFAGNNEDWKDPYSKMWFYPPDLNKHGWIKFGWGSGFPQGGMNDQGLFWDASSGAHLAMPLSEANKEEYPGVLMQKVIEECSNINEALAVFSEYYCQDQYKAQYLIGDSTGNSIIVEGDNYIPIASTFQILTNFYHSHPDLGGYPCWRYETAFEMLSNNYNLTPYFIGSILEATHQDGQYPTQYSNIYDLNNCHIFLFYYHNYDEFIKIDLKKELSKGYKSYNIPKLFSRVKLKAPSNGNNIASTTVTIRWEGKPGNSYTVIYSTDPDFNKSTSKSSIYAFDYSNKNSSFFYYLPLLLLTPLIRKKNTLSLSIIISFIVIFSSQCKKSEPLTPEVQVIEMTEILSDLLPNTTYYWKIEAHGVNQNHLHSETITRHFYTGGTSNFKILKHAVLSVKSTLFETTIFDYFKYDSWFHWE